MKDIPGFKGQYAITKDGKVWSHKSSKFMRPRKTLGYFVVTVPKNGKSHSLRIHRALLKTYVGPCPEGMVACHNNGIRDDNRLENLRWDTPSNNHKDAVKHGTHSGLKHGEDCVYSKLTETEVRWIRYLHKNRLFKNKEIADLFGIFRTTLDAIVARKTWTHI